MHTHNPVGWFEIYVQDLPRAKAFYENVFEVQLQKLDAPDPDIEMWAFPMQEQGTGASGALVKMGGRPSGGNSTLVYFSCSDCAVEARRAQFAGGHVVKEKFSIRFARRGLPALAGSGRRALLSVELIEISICLLYNHQHEIR
ncbi:MAG: VOC family protein [Candidatus Competibacter sp.]